MPVHGAPQLCAESVRQALTYVETGDADAGFASKALVNNEKVRTFDVDPALYDPIVQTLVMFIAMVVIISNLVVDMLYGVLDPRVRYGS